MIERRSVMDIWTLQRQGYSHREIGRRLGLDRRTVKKYIVSQELPRYRGGPRGSKLAPYHGMIRDWLGQEDYTAQRLHRMVTEQGYAGSYETVKRYVRRVKGERSRVAYLRFETEPGVQAQVDFGAFQVGDDGTTSQTLYLFALVLGYSRAMYTELVAVCTLPVFLECHQRAFGYLGGVPAEILYDNMRNVVIRHLAGRVEWNGRLLEFATHYRFQPLACPPYSPWVKGKVERPMDYLREGFWRGYRFVGLEQANLDLRAWLAAEANRRVHGTVHERVDVRWARERAHLGALPLRAFDTSACYWRKVARDCVVTFAGNQYQQYQVPHRAVGQTVLLKVHREVVRVFWRDELLAVYRIPAGRGRYLTQAAFGAALRADADQQRRKYPRGRGKGKATIWLRTEAAGSLHRDLREYDRLLAVAP